MASPSGAAAAMAPAATAAEEAEVPGGQDSASTGPGPGQTPQDLVWTHAAVAASAPRDPGSPGDVIAAASVPQEPGCLEAGSVWVQQHLDPMVPKHARLDRALCSAAVSLHSRKPEVLVASLVLPFLHDCAITFAYDHAKLLSFVLVPLEVGLAATLMLSSLSTLFLLDLPPVCKHWGAFFAKHGVRFEHARAIDYALDGLIGAWEIAISINRLFWSLDRGCSTYSASRFVLLVASRFMCASWMTFALCVYCPTSGVVSAALVASCAPKLYTLPCCFAVLQDVVASRVARLLRAVLPLVCAGTIGFMAWELVVWKNAMEEPRQDFSSGHARSCAAVLLCCDLLQLLLELARPVIITGELHVFPAIFIFLLICGCSTSLCLMTQATTSPYFLRHFVGTALVQFTASVFAFVLTIRNLARRVCTVIPPTSLGQVLEAHATPASTWRRLQARSGSRRVTDVSMGRSSASSIHRRTSDAAVLPPLELPLSGYGAMRPLRILCIDGGGIRGINATIMLDAIEKRCRRPAYEMFDLICGTSIGSCVGIGVATGMSTSMVLDSVDRLRDAVFAHSSTWRLLSTGSRIAEDTTDDYLKVVINSLGFSEGDLPPPAGSDCGTYSFPHYFSVAAKEHNDGNDHVWLPFVNSNYERVGNGFVVEGTHDWPLKAQIRASVAAPTYFPPYLDAVSGAKYVDGAVCANNPSMIALQEVRALWPGRPIGCFVSLGTGQNACGSRSGSDLLYWAGKFLSMPTETARTHREVEAALASYNPPNVAAPSYFRLNPVVGFVDLSERRAEVVLSYLEDIDGDLDYIKEALVDQFIGIP